MSSDALTKDLLVLSADGTIQRTVQTLLEERRDSMGISTITVDYQTHPHRDSGCRSAPEAVIKPSQGRYGKLMVLFDFHGSGENRRTATQLELDLERHLEIMGWGHDNVAVVSIEPELEAWVFGAHLQRIGRLMNWSHRQSVRNWLESNGHLSIGQSKPNDPQAAFDHMLASQRKSRSRRLFVDLARHVSLNHCQDRAFQKFRSTLQRWFPAK